MEETTVPVRTTSPKLPKFLNTITPFSKALALIMFIAFPIGGFYFGYKYKIPIQEKIVYIETPSKINSPTPDDLTLECTTNLCIEEGIVYYTDDKGNKTKIVESTDGEESPGSIHVYEYAELSPKRNFIHLSGRGWENNFDEIYDIKTKKIFNSDASGQLFWLNDERLLIIGGCGMGYMECGQIYLSIDGKTPWKQKLFAETPPY